MSNITDLDDGKRQVNELNILCMKQHYNLGVITITVSNIETISQ